LRSGGRGAVYVRGGEREKEEEEEEEDALLPLRGRGRRCPLWKERIAERLEGDGELHNGEEGEDGVRDEEFLQQKIGS
jgi:hypothetical protein